MAMGIVYLYGDYGVYPGLSTRFELAKIHRSLDIPDRIQSHWDTQNFSSRSLGWHKADVSKDDELQLRAMGWSKSWSSQNPPEWFIHRCKNQLFHAVPYCFKRAKQRAPNHCLKCPLLSSFHDRKVLHDECHTAASPQIA